MFRKIEIEFDQSRISAENLDTQIQARIEKLESLQKQEPFPYGLTKSQPDYLNLKKLSKNAEHQIKEDALRDFDAWLKMPKNKILWDAFNAASSQKPTSTTAAKNTSGFEETTISTQRKPSVEDEKLASSTKRDVVNLLKAEKNRLMKRYDLQSELKVADHNLKEIITQKQDSKLDEKITKVAIQRVQAIDKLLDETAKKDAINSSQYLRSKLIALKKEMKSTGRWFGENSRNSNFFASNKDNIDKAIKLVSPKKEGLLSRLIHKIRRS